MARPALLGIEGSDWKPLLGPIANSPGGHLLLHHSRESGCTARTVLLHTQGLEKLLNSLHQQHKPNALLLCPHRVVQQKKHVVQLD